ncbi:TMV resistance protein N-like [Bidens hawaiensis]|uniref:TMV resistance protein N-like n=1 Tax=Bidens hawaiensis TaxID=980011 RepID=UPI0040497174
MEKRGAGKTTLARAIVDKLSANFEAKSFIENVREVSKASLSGLLSLQRQLISDLLKDQCNSISSVHDGRNMMKRMMCARKVLVVLDDVDHKDQLEALVGEPAWFKIGSRIIITTRDEQVLIGHRVKLIQDVSLLSDEEAIRLFNIHAFGRDVPTERYEKLALEVVHYAAGLPLTVKVLGSFLCGKDELEWMDALERLKAIPLKETLDKLELSYISLEHDYKEIFLDVACFLKGWEKDKVIRLLESCGFHARNGLRVLEQKSLIVTTKAFHTEFIDMHHHIEEMGKNIVRRLHPDEPYRHSRLWIREEIEDVLANNMGTESTRCIYVKLTPEIVVEGLGYMKKLRCLIIDHRNYNNDYVDQVKIDEGNQYLPNVLRYLNWFRYPHRCLPKTFQGNNLVALEMHDSRIEQLWEGGKVLKKLKFLELQRSKLKNLDLGLIPNLERLDLSGCYHLSELHVPIGCLKMLVYLNLRWCRRLKSFSFIKHLESLEFLNLGYLSLWEFPDIIPQQNNTSLIELDFSSNNVAELPSSIGKFHKLVSLKLSGCKRLKNLPESILDQLKSLKKLSLRGCKIKEIPDTVCKLNYLKELDLCACSALEKLPENLGDL